LIKKESRSVGGSRGSGARINGRVTQARVNKVGRRHLITTAIVDFNGLVSGTLPNTIKYSAIMAGHRRRNLARRDTKIEETIRVCYVTVRHGLACVRTEMGDRHLRMIIESRRKKGFK
jgi:hypothetical protein